MSQLTYAERWAIKHVADDDPQGMIYCQIAVCPERQMRAEPEKHQLTPHQFARADHLRAVGHRLRDLREHAYECRAQRQVWRSEAC